MIPDQNGMLAFIFAMNYLKQMKDGENKSNK